MAVLRAIERLSVERARRGLSIHGEVTHAAADAYLEEQQSECGAQEARNEVSRHGVHHGLLSLLWTQVSHQNPLAYVQVLQRNFQALIIIDALDGWFEIGLVQWKKATLLASGRDVHVRSPLLADTIDIAYLFWALRSKTLTGRIKGSGASDSENA